MWRVRGPALGWNAVRSNEVARHELVLVPRNYAKATGNIPVTRACCSVWQSTALYRFFVLEAFSDDRTSNRWLHYLPSLSLTRFSKQEKLPPPLVRPSAVAQPNNKMLPTRDRIMLSKAFLHVNFSACDEHGWRCYLFLWNALINL